MASRIVPSKGRSALCLCWPPRKPARSIPCSSRPKIPDRSNGNGCRAPEQRREGIFAAPDQRIRVVIHADGNTASPTTESMAATYPGDEDVVNRHGSEKSSQGMVASTVMEDLPFAAWHRVRTCSNPSCSAPHRHLDALMSFSFETLRNKRTHLLNQTAKAALPTSREMDLVDYMVNCARKISAPDRAETWTAGGWGFRIIRLTTDHQGVHCTMVKSPASLARNEAATPERR